MAASGSTAPAIASPLLAWPSRPSPRFNHPPSPTSPPPSSISHYAASNANGIGLGLPSTASTSTSSGAASSSSSASNSAASLPYLNGSGPSHPRYSARSVSASVAESSSRARMAGLGLGNGVGPVDEDAEGYLYGGDNGPHLRVDDGIDGQYRRDYAPPTRPLSPHQLSRIAQSFGIVIPTLPVASPSPSSSPVLRSISPISFASRVRTRSATPSSSLSHSHSHHHSHLSHFLLSVIPPSSLLPPSPMPDHDSAGGMDAETGRVKRWRRGRLLPLQPTLGAMLVSIAREFGLPSTSGVGIYLVQSSPSLKSVHRDSLSSEMGAETDPLSGHGLGNGQDSEDGIGSGPLISASTWTTLFAAYIHASASAASTPASTPHRGQRILHAQANGPAPLSPLSLVLDHNIPTSSKTEQSRRRPLSFSAGPTPVKAPSHSSLSSASSHLPVTPVSMTHPHISHVATSPGGSSLAPTTLSTGSLPIVGTIEFDVDPIEATWFDEWQRSGGALRRRTGSQADTGMRELKLVQGRLASDGRPRFLREIDTQRANLPASEADAYAALVSDEEGEDEEGEQHRGSVVEIHLPEDEDPLGDMFPSAAAEFAALRAGRPNVEHRLSIKDIGTNRALSASASMSAFEDDGADEEQAGTSAGRTGQDDVDEIRRIIRERDEMLASPIDLGAGMTERLMGPSRLALGGDEEDDKRGSGLVMADQLDNLEKIMRDLSPREIRLTSPRQLTPRTASKIGINTNPSTYPSAGASSSATTGTSAGSHLSSRPLTATKPPSSPLAGTFIGPDGLPVPATYPQPNSSNSSRGPTPAPAWPAVPFAQMGESPGSPSSISEYFRRDTNPSPSGSTLSTETMQRMQSEAAAAAQPRTIASEWKPPRRPTMPTTPTEAETSKLASSSGHATALPPPPRTSRSSSASASSPSWMTAVPRDAASNHGSHGTSAVTPTLPVAAEMDGTDRPSPALSNASDEGSTKRRTRSSSISLKGLRSKGSKSNLKKEKEKAPEVPALPTVVPSVVAPTPPNEPIGLFRGATVEASNSSFTGLRADSASHHRPSVDEFGQVTSEAGDEADRRVSAVSTSSSLPSKGKDKDTGFASRFFSFGAKRKDVGGAHAPPEIHPPLPDGKSRSVSGPQSARRTPSESTPSSATAQGMRSTSATSATFPHYIKHSAARSGSGSVDYTQGQTSPTSPGSQSSPRTVRRKPVPGINDGEGRMSESPSIGSVASVLEQRHAQ